MGRVTVVKASAGSGKTYKLSYEYVRRVMSSTELYRGILAVTFTNKATEEMKRRIIGEINDLANGHTSHGKKPEFLDALSRELDMSPEYIESRAKKVRTKILHDYSHFTILTIDKFFQRIIRAFIRELGVESDFTLELQADSVLSAAADRLIEETVIDNELREWIVNFIEEQISDGKRWDIKKEIVELGKEIFKDQYRYVNSPKSKDDIQKAINSAYASVLKVKTEMIGLAKQAIAVIEDHNLCLADFSYGKGGFANYFYKVASGDYASGYGVRVREALESEDKWCTKSSKKRDDIMESIIELYPLLAKITNSYDNNISFINTTILLKENFRTYAMLKDLSGYVREICDSRNIMLISETNHIINKLIAGNDAPFIFEKVGNNFSHYMIDEFQDTSLTQWNNFYPLLTNATSQSEDSPVLIVGDVKQSIYRWRGGDWEILGERVGESFSEIENVTLDKNFRSSGVIVDFNNSLISNCIQIDNALLNEKLLGSEQEDKLTDMLGKAYTDSRQVLAKKSLSEDGYVKIITQSKSAQEDTNYLIEIVEELQSRGYRAKDIAIIVRYNFEAVSVANLLLEHKSAHSDSLFCYDVVTSEALTIGASAVVQFITACFRLATNIEDSISAGLYSKYITGNVDSKLTQSQRDFIGSLRYVSLEEAFENVVMEYDLDKIPHSVAYLQAYHDRLLSFANTKISDIPLFLKWWDDKGSSESVYLPGGQDAITIITIHKSKGLQYPAVIMPFASWGVTPKSSTLLWATTDKEPFASLGAMPIRFKKEMANSYFAGEYYKELVYSHIDNMNMLYVALTRAERELFMMMPKVKRMDGVRVNEFIISALANMEMNVSENGDDTIYDCGSRSRYEQKSDEFSDNTIVMNSYPTYKFDGKLRIRQSNNMLGISPRSKGELMHKVFESIRTVQDIVITLSKFEQDGLISSDERIFISEIIDKSLQNPIINEWFNGDWDEIRNENDIIVPSEKAFIRRPDRVLIKGDRVVVIDYKFGQKEAKSYDTQLSAYLHLVREMGFRDVSGYLWYVEMDKIVNVILT